MITKLRPLTIADWDPMPYRDGNRYEIIDRVNKLQLYAKHGVPEYWIVDPPNMTLERYVHQGSSLVLLETLENEDSLSTTTLPGFSCKVSEIFRRIGR